MFSIKRFIKTTLLVALAASPTGAAKLVKMHKGEERPYSKKVASAFRATGKESARQAGNTRGNYEAFLEHLAQKESGGNYEAVNRFGYLGKYQMGEMALIQAGFYKADGNRRRNDWNGQWTRAAQEMQVASREAFLKNPKAQEEAMRSYTQKNWYMIRALGLDEYIGRTVTGVQITASGLLAGAHLVGVGGLRSFLLSGRNVEDGNNIHVSHYIEQFGGFHTPFMEEHTPQIAAVEETTGTMVD